MNERKTVIAINLETLERSAYPSFVTAAEHCGVSKFTVSKCYYTGTAFNGWCFCSPEQLDERKERIRQLSAKWVKEGMPIRKKYVRKPPKETVSIRIDAHTTIIVDAAKVPTPKDREAYAERYRERLKSEYAKRLKQQHY